MSHKVVFFTGAGISIDSGIPTFQAQEGIRDKLTRDFCSEHYDEYIENIKSMKKQWIMHSQTQLTMQSLK